MNLWCFTIRGLRERKLILLHGYHCSESDDIVLHTVLLTQDWRGCGWLDDGWIWSKGWNRVYISAGGGFGVSPPLICILSVLYSNFWFKDCSFTFVFENPGPLFWDWKSYIMQGWSSDNWRTHVDSWNAICLANEKTTIKILWLILVLIYHKQTSGKGQVTTLNFSLVFHRLRI
jgi:hypothetical protein